MSAQVHTFKVWCRPIPGMHLYESFFFSLWLSGKCKCVCVYVCKCMLLYVVVVVVSVWGDKNKNKINKAERPFETKIAH